MTEVELDIKQWGNNLGVRLPAVVARAAQLNVDQRVHLRRGQGYCHSATRFKRLPEAPFSDVCQRLNK